MGFEAGGNTSQSKQNVDATTSKKKNISQEGIDKLIYDVLSAENGLAQLVSGEGLAGGNSSSSKTLMAQDFTTKIIGELANITAEETTKVDATTRNRNTEAGSKVGSSASLGSMSNSVICTELIRQELLDKSLHQATHQHWLTIPEYTKQGYWLWAVHVVPLMQRSPKLSAALSVVATARCEMIVTGKFNLPGAVTLYIGQPLCNLLGRAISCVRKSNGTTQLSA